MATSSPWSSLKPLVIGMAYSEKGTKLTLTPGGRFDRKPRIFWRVSTKRLGAFSSSGSRGASMLREKSIMTTRATFSQKGSHAVRCTMGEANPITLKVKPSRNIAELT